MTKEDDKMNEVLRQYWEEAWVEEEGELNHHDPIVGKVVHFLSSSQGKNRPPRQNQREITLFKWADHYHAWDGGANGRGPWDDLASEVLGDSVSADEAETELHHQIEAEVRRLKK